MLGRKLEIMCQSLLRYRQAQILSTMYNRIHQSVLIPTFVLAFLFSFSGAIFVLCKGLHTLTIISTLFFSDVLLTGVLNTLFCWYYPIGVVQMSRRCKSAWKVKDHKSRYKRKLLLKWGNSFSPIRIFLFQSIYFDRITPYKFSNTSLQSGLKLTLLG